MSKSNIEILSNPAKSGQSGRIRPLFQDGNPVPVPAKSQQSGSGSGQNFQSRRTLEAVLGGRRYWEGGGIGREAVLGGRRYWEGGGIGREAVLGGRRYWEGGGIEREAVLEGRTVLTINYLYHSMDLPVGWCVEEETETRGMTHRCRGQIF